MFASSLAKIIHLRFLIRMVMVFVVRMAKDTTNFYTTAKHYLTVANLHRMHLTHFALIVVEEGGLLPHVMMVYKMEMKLELIVAVIVVHVGPALDVRR
jgi:hypothetical protein